MRCTSGELRRSTELYVTYVGELRAPQCYWMFLDATGPSALLHAVVQA